MLHRLVYTSEITSDHPIDIEKIVREAARFNDANDLTGALWFDGTFFIQLLEGEKDRLKNIFENRIASSCAHHDIILSSFAECPDRLFKDWSMAYLGENSHSNDIAKQFMEDHNFNPRDCTSDDLINLLCFLEEDRQRNMRDAIL